jgi:hypothetical protein
LDSSREEGGAGTAPPRERQEHARTGGEASGGAAGAGGGGPAGAGAGTRRGRRRMGCGRRLDLFGFFNHGRWWMTGCGANKWVRGVCCAPGSSTHGNKLPLSCVLKGGARQTQN